MILSSFFNPFFLFFLKYFSTFPLWGWVCQVSWKIPTFYFFSLLNPSLSQYEVLCGLVLVFGFLVFSLNKQSSKLIFIYSSTFYRISPQPVFQSLLGLRNNPYLYTRDFRLMSSKSSFLWPCNSLGCIWVYMACSHWLFTLRYVLPILRYLHCGFLFQGYHQSH